MSDTYTLYLLSEDDNDDEFYYRSIEKMTKKSFTIESRRLRKGGGISAVRKAIPRLLKKLKYNTKDDLIYFLITLDNDRCPAHPQHNHLQYNKLSKKENNRCCRFCEIEKMIKTEFGDDKEQWPIQGAIAVPVEMLESWLLLICNQTKYIDEESLPLFPSMNKPAAKDYYKKKLKEQLKDLKLDEMKALNITSNKEFCIYCSEHLNPDLLAGNSSSFKLFKEQVDEWFV